MGFAEGRGEEAFGDVFAALWGEGCLGDGVVEEGYAFGGRVDGDGAAGDHEGLRRVVFGWGAEFLGGRDEC